MTSNQILLFTAYVAISAAVIALIPIFRGWAHDARLKRSARIQILAEINDLIRACEDKEKVHGDVKEKLNSDIRDDSFFIILSPNEIRKFDRIRELIKETQYISKQETESFGNIYLAYRKSSFDYSGERINYSTVKEMKKLAEVIKGKINRKGNLSKYFHKYYDVLDIVL